jgi:hypothetical protein
MFLGTFSWGFTLEAISQMPAAAPMPEQMNQTQLNANNCVKDEGPIFGPVCFVVRQSQPPFGDAPSSRLASGPNLWPRHLLPFMR